MIDLMYTLEVMFWLFLAIMTVVAPMLFLAWLGDTVPAVYQRVREWRMK